MASDNTDSACKNTIRPPKSGRYYMNYTFIHHNPPDGFQLRIFVLVEDGRLNPGMVEKNVVESTPVRKKNAPAATARAPSSQAWISTDSLVSMDPFLVFLTLIRLQPIALWVISLGIWDPGTETGLFIEITVQIDLKSE